MYIFIVKDEHIHAISTDEPNNSEYSLLVRDDIPTYPEDGKHYKLDLVNGEPGWVEIERPVDPTEALTEIVDRLGI